MLIMQRYAKVFLQATVLAKILDDDTYLYILRHGATFPCLFEVTSLSTKFSENSLIGSFLELKYFTNVKSFVGKAFLNSSVTHLDVSNISSIGTGTTIFKNTLYLDRLIFYGIYSIPQECFNGSGVRYILLLDMPQKGTMSNYNAINLAVGKVYIPDEWYDDTTGSGTWKNYGKSKTKKLSEFPEDFPEDAEELGLD